MALGAATLAFLRDKRLLLLAPILAVVTALVLPREVERRVESFLTPDTSGIRIECYSVDRASS